MFLWSHVYVWYYRLTVSPGQSSLLFFVALVALAEVEQNEHVQHNPHQRSGQNHLAVGKPPHPKNGIRERERKAWMMVSADLLHTFTGFSKALQRRSLSMSSHISPALLLTPLNHHPPHSSMPSIFSVPPFVLLSESLLLSVSCLSAQLQMVTFTLRESLKMNTGLLDFIIITPIGKQ